MKEPPDKPDQRMIIAVAVIAAGAALLAVFGYAVLDIARTFFFRSGG